MRSWLKPCTTKKLSETDAAWLAGFVDGEGTIASARGGRGGRYITWKLSVPNTHYGSLQHCLDVTNVGSITPRMGIGDNRKPIWHWQVFSQANIASILRQILPYLVIKREAALRFLEWFNAQNTTHIRPQVVSASNE